MADLLVIGARQDSIGEAVVEQAQASGWRVNTVGIEEEELYIDLNSQNLELGMIMQGLMLAGYHAVVCTAGINEESSILRPLDRRHMGVNYHGHMLALTHWLRYWDAHPELHGVVPPAALHWVSVSSNSAHIARSQSLSYCASKAALSMGIRCAAREMADKGPYAIYGYEPGWVDDTPMSEDVERRLDREAGAMMRGTQLHRIPGGNTMHRAVLASIIVDNLARGTSLNGCMIRLDGGEQ